MKIEIDLEKIFVGESYTEDGEVAEQIDFNTAIRNAVIDRIISTMGYDFKRKIQDELNSAITVGIKEEVKKVLAEKIPNFLDMEFTDTSSWGETKGTWTVRNRILKEIENQCVFKSGGYSSDRNYFSNAILEAAETEIKKWKSEFKTHMDAVFMKEIIHHATGEIKKKLGL